MKPIITRVRILHAAHGADGKPTMFRGIVMQGAKVVASTANLRSRHACVCVAETLRAAHNVAARGTL